MKVKLEWISKVFVYWCSLLKILKSCLSQAFKGKGPPLLFRILEGAISLLHKPPFPAHAPYFLLKIKTRIINYSNIITRKALQNRRRQINLQNQLIVYSDIYVCIFDVNKLRSSNKIANNWQCLKVNAKSERFTLGSVLVNDFWTPPPINFVHDHLFFSKFIIVYFLLFRVRLG